MLLDTKATLLSLAFDKIWFKRTKYIKYLIMTRGICYFNRNGDSLSTHALAMWTKVKDRQFAFTLKRKYKYEIS